MNRVELKSRLANQFQNSVYYESVDLNASIQDGLDEVAAFTGCIYKTASIPFSQFTTYYDLLTLLPDYIGVVAIFNATIRRWLFPTSLKKLNQVRIDWDTAYGTPYYFCPISHRYVAIFMKPAVANYGKMYIFYRAAAPTLNDSAEIPIPDEHITALESYSIQDLWEQGQEFGKAEQYFQTYVSNIEQLRLLMRNKLNSDRVMSLK